MRPEFADYEQELICFFISLLKSVDLSKFPLDDSNGLSRYICVSIRNKYIELSKTQQNEAYNCFYAKDEKTNIFDTLAQTDLYSNPALLTELKDGLAKLSKKQKTVLYYRYFCGLSDEEIGNKTNTSRQSVNGTRNRALNKLRNQPNT